MPTFQDLAGFWDLLQLSIEDVTLKVLDPAACSCPGENARSWEALGGARPGQSSLSAGSSCGERGQLGIWEEHKTQAQPSLRL